MDVTKIFTICLVITVILLVINLLRVESFKDHKTISVTEMDGIRNSIFNNLKPMPTFFTNPDEHKKLLATQISQMETISSQPFPSLNVKNLDKKIDEIITQQQNAVKAAKESECEKSSTLPNKDPILISRYRRIEIQFDGTNKGGKIKLKADKFLKAITKQVNPVNTVKYELSSADAAAAAAANFYIIEIKDASEYLNNIDKFSNDYITIDPKIVYPFYLIQYEDDTDYCLSVNKVENETYIYLKPISGNKEEQFEIPSE